MEIVLMIFMAYLGLGLLFSLFFAAVGSAKLDPVAKGASVGFRILIVPASIALWPLLISRLTQRGGRES